MPGFRPNSWPIAVRITVDLLVAALVPLILGIWLTSSRGIAALESEAESNLELLAGVTAAQLQQLLDDTERVLLQVAGDDRIVDFVGGDEIERERLRESVQRRLELVTASNRDFASIFVTNDLGIGLASTSAANVGQDLTFREYWRRGRAGINRRGAAGVYISDVLVGKNSREPGIYFAAPIRRADLPADGLDADAIIGVAVLKLSGMRIWEIVESVSVGDSGHAMLTDALGIVLAHPDHALHYRSLGTLPVEATGELDPRLAFSIDAIESMELPELMVRLTSKASEGAGTYERGDEQWVVGWERVRGHDWVVSVTLPHAQFAAPLLSLRRQQWFVGIGVALLAAAYAVARARTLVRPIRSLTSAATRIAHGDFSASVEVTGDDELAQLGRTFNAMVPKLREHVELRQSLGVAMEVQQALLPANSPEIDGVDIAGRSRYCDETGGDYFDFIDVSAVSPHSTLVALGDVMGHGVASALLMATARAALRASAAQGESLGVLLGKVNDVLAADSRHGRFMTMLLAVIDAERREVRWASAGHDPIIRFDPATDAFDELDGADLPLGVMAGSSYEQFVRDGLQPGQILLIGTDGIWEMRNAQREMYGKDRLREVIRRTATESAAALADAIEADLAAFRGAERQEDDVTFVVARLTPLAGA